MLVLSQDYTEDKDIKFKKISNGKILTKVILLIITIWVIFLMVSLMRFHPSDPSWSETTWNELIKNLVGDIGTYSANILFSIFGILAYVIPLVILLGCWNVFKDIDNQNYLDFFVLSLRLIGGLVLIITSCALAAINIDDLPNFSSGGIIGSIFSNVILTWFNILGTTLALLLIWAISFTLFTRWSWLTIAERIGALVLAKITLITNNTRSNNKHQETETYISPHLSKLDDSISPHTADYIDPDDVLFSIPPIKQLAKEGLSNNKNDQSYRDKGQSLTPDEAKVVLDIQAETLDKYAEDIFSKPSNIPVTMDDGVDLNQRIDPNHLTQVSDQKETIILAKLLISSVTKIDAEDDASTAFTPVKSQIKKGIGPEFPRPNPVRLPTRRELYGNRLTTQKEQELDAEQKVFQNSAIQSNGAEFSID